MLDPKKEKVFSNEERLTFLQVDEFSAEKLLSWLCSTERNYAVWIHKWDLTALTTVLGLGSVTVHLWGSMLKVSYKRGTWGKHEGNFWFMFVTLFLICKGFSLPESWSGIACREIYCLLWVLCDLWITSQSVFHCTHLYDGIEFMKCWDIKSFFFPENREEDSVLWQVSNTWLGIVCSTCHPRRRNGTNSLLNCPH
jgi:hypothetical protein